MNVVIAIDGSIGSMQAVEYVAQLPFRSKPKITLVTALVDTPYDLVSTSDGLKLREAEQEQSAANFDAATKILDGCCEAIERVLQRQYPNELIIETAKERNADLIVLGARGHSAMYRVWIGSTADYIANHAKCSVLLFRNPAEEAPPRRPEASAEVAAEGGGEPQGEHPFPDKPVAQSLAPEDRGEPRTHEIMIAYDSSPNSTFALEQVAQFDWPADEARIHLVTMIERPKYLPEEVEYDHALTEELMEKTKAACNNLQLECPVEYSVRETRHIGNGLWSASNREGTNLMVVGSTGKWALTRFFMGSTSRYLMHHVECSMWIARTKKWS